MPHPFKEVIIHAFFILKHAYAKANAEKLTFTDDPKKTADSEEEPEDEEETIETFSSDDT